MRILPEETGAIIVDIQEKLVPAMSSPEACCDRAKMIISGMKLFDIPMIITQQYTKGLGNSLPFVFECAGTDKFYDKGTFSCCKDENIMAAIEAMGKKNIVVMGVEAHVCVLQTCIDLKALGYQPILVTDAIASRKESDKQMGIQRAMQEGVLVTSAEALLFELTLDSKNPVFKQVSKLVK